MRISSPVYDDIKTRALELLYADDGYNGHSFEEIRSWRKGEWVSRNTIGVAVCQARDELYARVATNGMSIEQRMKAYRELRFNKANHHKLQAEINRIVKQGG
jgi:hypothetical protein